MTARTLCARGYLLGRTGAVPRREERQVAEKKGNGSGTAQKANAKASKEGKKNPRKSSSAQAELGKKGGKKSS